MKSKLWDIGRTLMTSTTRRWSKEEINKNNYSESLMVFENFSPFDEGKSRKRVCVCDDPDTAIQIVKEHNDHESIIEENKRLREALENSLEWINDQFGNIDSPTLLKAKEALTENRAR